MGAEKVKDPAEWLMGNVGKPARQAPASRLLVGEYAPSADEIDSLLSDSAGNGTRVAAALRRGTGSLKELAAAGFTFDLLVTMVQEKAPYPRGAKHKLSREQVIAALKGLFAIGEYLSP